MPRQTNHPEDSRTAAPNTGGMGRSLISSTGGILMGRVTGLLRDVCAAAYWGATGVAQAAYTTAFAIPNIFRNLFGEGAANGAFVPILSAHLEEDDKERAWRIASRAITAQFLILILLTVLASVIALALGMTGLFKSESARTAVKILPVLMPFTIFICGTAAFGAVMQSMNAFFLSYASQAIFNIVQVASLGILAWGWRNDEPAALWLYCGSTLLAGFLQMLALLLKCRRLGYRYRFDFDFKDPEVRMLGRKYIPVLVGNGANMINSFIDSILAISLGAAAVGALNYSHRLVYLPVGLFGVAMGSVGLRALSRAQARGDQQGVADGLDYALRTVMFLALPCTAYLLVAGRDVITFLFARGAFTQEAINESSFALFFYMMGLPAICGNKVATNPFHARKDTFTPMCISIGCVILNLILNLILMQYLRQGGLALATSICAWLNMALLLALNKRHLSIWTPRRALKAAIPLLLAAAAAGAACHYTIAMLDAGGLAASLPRTLFAAAKVFGGLAATSAAYLAACVLLRRPEPRELLAAVRRR